MTRLRGSWTATAAMTLFLLSACAQATGSIGEASSPSPSDPAVPATADQLVLRVDSAGGLRGNRGQETRIPQVSVYGDGRVLSGAPVPASYPGPAMINMQVQLAPPATVSDLLAKGEALLAKGGDPGRPGLADGTTTSITVKGKTISVYALSEAQAGDPALTSAQRTRGTSAQGRRNPRV